MLYFKIKILFLFLDFFFNLKKIWGVGNREGSGGDRLLRDSAKGWM